MTEKNWNFFTTILSILFVLAIGLLIQKNRATELKLQQAESRVPAIPPGPTYQKVRNFDTKTQSWINYSDEEIRMIREIHSYNPEGSYIHTPGRTVPTFEERVQEYLEDNLEDYELDN